MRLSAWYDGEHVMFCMGNAGENTKFHGGFSRVSDLLRFRYDNSVRIIGHRLVISSALGRNLSKRLSLAETSGGFALINDKKGAYTATDRNKFGTKTIKSKLLVGYVEQKLGATFMYGVPIEGGVAFSNDRYIRPQDIQTEELGKTFHS
jgi:hypothetical protein